MNILFYDTETTGLPNRSKGLTDPCQPRVTQLGFLYEEDGKDVFELDTLIKPTGPEWQISATAQALTGITREQCEAEGTPLGEVMDIFVDYAASADVLICHNVAFDSLIMQMEAKRLAPDLDDTRAIFEGSPHVCTMLAALPICRIPKKNPRQNGWKWPKLEEAYRYFYNEPLDGAHNAMVDILATRRVFRTLCNQGAMDKPFRDVGFAAAPRYEGAA